jgi:hypothetical protein
MWAGRTSEAAALAERFEIGWWYAETAPTPRCVFLATVGADVQTLRPPSSRSLTPREDLDCGARES